MACAPASGTAFAFGHTTVTCSAHDAAGNAAPTQSFDVLVHDTTPPAIQAHAERQGFSVVREFCGHGIGRKFHEEPQVLHYGKAGTGLTLQPGMTFTVEPMINAGKPGIRELADGWTIVTKDHSLSAQWEHTVAVTADGFEVLTLSAGVQPAPAIGSEAASK